MTTTPADPIRVLIVDDHTVVRIGLRTLLTRSAGFRVVGEAQTVAEAVQLNEQTHPDVVLMDVRLPDGSGVEACRRIKADHPDARVLMLTSYSDEEAIVGSVRKTNRCVVVEEGWPMAGFGAEISDRVQRECFDALDAPVVRVTAPDVPMPYSKILEKAYVPQPERVVEAVNAVLYRGKQ